jgi:hypothetical protein
MLLDGALDNEPRCIVVSREQYCTTCIIEHNNQRHVPLPLSCTVTHQMKGKEQNGTERHDMMGLPVL